jgi:hypothetical protein
VRSRVFRGLCNGHQDLRRNACHSLRLVRRLYARVQPPLRDEGRAALGRSPTRPNPVATRRGLSEALLDFAM